MRQKKPSQRVHSKETRQDKRRHARSLLPWLVGKVIPSSSFSARASCHSSFSSHQYLLTYRLSLHTQAIDAAAAFALPPVTLPFPSPLPRCSSFDPLQLGRLGTPINRHTQTKAKLYICGELSSVLPMAGKMTCRPAAMGQRRLRVPPGPCRGGG